MSEQIDWRERKSTVLSDLYDGDRHLIIGSFPGRAHRAEVRIPHPLPGVAYADGIVSNPPVAAAMDGEQ
jgi:hypothetical protein